MNNTEQLRRKQLGEFLKTKRKSLNPAAYGFFSKNRKTSGLRREEVALLVDVSIDWYTWLEQGRDINVSARVLYSIAEVFHLNDKEIKHLFLLAQQAVPIIVPQTNDRVSPIVQKFLDHQATAPSYVTNLKWDIIAWNDSACAVFGDYNKMTGLQRNSIWRAFNSHYMKKLLDDWELHAQKRVAQFRASYSLLYKDPWYEKMKQELCTNSDFKRWWNLYDVEESPCGDKLLHHPVVGDLCIDHLSFKWCDNPNLLITVHMPSDSSSQKKILSLMSNGEQICKID